jgi:hypothetical protein
MSKKDEENDGLGLFMFIVALSLAAGASLITFWVKGSPELAAATFLIGWPVIFFGLLRLFC